MRSRMLSVIVGLVIANSALIMSCHHALAVAPPTCLDFATGDEYTATKWLTSPGTLVGTSGHDVLVGSIGSDVIKGGAGNDIICTEPLDVMSGDQDTVDGGSGRDSIVGFGTISGGSGNDWVFAAGPGSVGDGGSGNDLVVSLDASVILGGAGNDTLVNETGLPTTSIDCGSGRDSVDANGATDVRRCEVSAAP